MTRLCRSFTAEFKLEAASLALYQAYSISESSCSLDIGETVLQRRVEQLLPQLCGTTPISKAADPRAAENPGTKACIN